MKSSMTAKQHKAFIKMFEEEYRKEYESVLRAAESLESDPSFDQAMLVGAATSGSHVLSRIALVRAARKFRILGFSNLQDRIEKMLFG